MTTNKKRTELPSGRGARGDFVYKSLLDGIREGRLAAGDRLLEEEIAHSIGVSRTPVREAIAKLQARRLIETVPGRGIFIARLDTRQVMELYAMREVLEGAAARFAAQHALPAEIAIMKGLADEFDAAKGDTARLARVNTQFHRVIYEAARNRYMHEALDNLGEALSLLQNTTFSLADRHAPASEEHRAILDAIEKRDAEQAEALSRAHIREAQIARFRVIMGQ